MNLQTTTHYGLTITAEDKRNYYKAMTAEEIAQDLIDNHIESDIPDILKAGIRESIKEYAKSKCKEQRELCYENHWNESCRLGDDYFEDEIRDAIIEAPEPEFK